MKKILTALLPLLLAASPALARVPGKSADPALWVVKDKDTTIYLFGTVHVLKPGTVWFDDEIKAALDGSDALMLEIVEPDPAQMAAEVSRVAIAADGVPLSEKLSPEAREKYKAAMTQAGLPWQGLERLEPWMAGLTLAVAPLRRLGYSDEIGAEKVLTDAAKAAGKPVGGLETVAEQLGYFDGLPEAQQISFLNATVDGMADVEKDFATLVADWEAGKPEALAKEMNASLEATPELAQVLLFDRNARWAQWIKARMAQPGTVFIAVGAGHLAGERSVQNDLAAMGLRAKRIGKAYFRLK